MDPNRFRLLMWHKNLGTKDSRCHGDRGGGAPGIPICRYIASVSGNPCSVSSIFDIAVEASAWVLGAKKAGDASVFTRSTEAWSEPDQSSVQ